MIFPMLSIFNPPRRPKVSKHARGHVGQKRKKRRNR